MDRHRSAAPSRCPASAVSDRAQVRRMLISQFAVLLQRHADDAIQFFRNSRIPGAGRFRVAAQNRLVNDRLRRAGERRLPGSHFVQGRAKLNRSVRASSSNPRACSGDMYGTVPTAAPGVVSCSSVGRPVFASARAGLGGGAAFARPKCRILACPRAVIKMFAGLLSRCTIPFACAEMPASRGLARLRVEAKKPLPRSELQIRARRALRPAFHPTPLSAVIQTSKTHVGREKRSTVCRRIAGNWARPNISTSVVSNK
jgi:hypothetical protein